jgi:hypothetical protein
LITSARDFTCGLAFGFVAGGKDEPAEAEFKQLP